MSHGWTPERRARQAAAIRRWQPWNHSTGPKTEQGKARAGQNAFKGGHRRALRAEVRIIHELFERIESMINCYPALRDTNPSITQPNARARE